MTRNFSDAWEASQHDDDNPDVAPQRVQDDVSALLRGAAQSETPAMPAGVEARLRAALAAESAAAKPPEATDHPAESPQRPATIVPLPGRTSAPTVSENATSTARPLSAHATPSPTPVPATPQAAPAAGTAGSHRTDGGVASLSEHRARKRSWTKPVLALGAAAAVAIGAVGIVKGMDHGSPSGEVADGSTSQNALAYDDRVHVTQTNTKYVSSSLTTQAAAMLTSKSPELTDLQHEAPGLGAGTSKTGIQSCLNALEATANEKPDSVHADLGTYDGKQAVIVVVEKGGKKTVWVVTRTCTQASDKLAGPQPLTT